MKKIDYMWIYIAIIFSLGLIGGLIGHQMNKSTPQHQIMRTFIGGIVGIIIGTIVMIIIKKTKEDKDPEAK